MMIDSIYVYECASVCLCNQR